MYIIDHNPPVAPFSHLGTERACVFVGCMHLRACAFLPERLLKCHRVSLLTYVLFCARLCVCVFLFVVNKSVCQHMCCVAFALYYLMPRQYSVRIRRPATSA